MKYVTHIGDATSGRIRLVGTAQAVATSPATAEGVGFVIQDEALGELQEQLRREDLLFFGTRQERETEAGNLMVRRLFFIARAASCEAAGHDGMAANDLLLADQAQQWAEDLLLCDAGAGPLPAFYYWIGDDALWRESPFYYLLDHQTRRDRLDKAFGRDSQKPELHSQGD
jgi:hypothetical protein